MALLAGFSPEQVFGLGGALLHPLRGSEGANRRGQRLTRKVTTRISPYTHFGWVRGNVFTECFDEKYAYDFRLIVGNTVVEALVEREQMATRASIREFHRRHQLPPGERTRRPQSFGAKRHEFVGILEADCCRAAPPFGRSQGRTGNSSAMAVATFELNIGAVWSAADQLHVDGVIQFDRAGI